MIYTLHSAQSKSLTIISTSCRLRNKIEQTNSKPRKGKISQNLSDLFQFLLFLFDHISDHKIENTVNSCVFVRWIAASFRHSQLELSHFSFLSVTFDLRSSVNRGQPVTSKLYFILRSGINLCNQRSSAQ